MSVMLNIVSLIRSFIFDSKNTFFHTFNTNSDDNINYICHFLTPRLLHCGRMRWTEPRAGIGDRFLVQRFLAPQRVRQERRWSKDV